jgi:ankyrin repeat protein
MEKLNEDFMYACIQGNLEEAERLISEGADINYKNRHTFNALHNASLYGRTTIAKMLIEKGLDVNNKNDDENAPLHLAAGNNRPE